MEPQPFPNVAPTKLSINIAGDISMQNTVTLENGVVSGQCRGRSFSIRPDAGTWTRFIQEINKAKLYKWAPDYPNPGVYDGTRWYVEIQFGERIFKSKGDNNFPTEGNESKPTNAPSPCGVPFQTLCAAVSHLIGDNFN